MPVTSSIERITPKIAAQLLRTNVRNRRVKQGHVGRIAREITRGRFHLNGSSIVIDEHGNIIDGQHRLLAIIEAGVAVYVVIVRGVAATVSDTIDSGIRRTAGDALTMRGGKNVTVTAAAIKLAAAYPTILGAGAPALTNGEVLEIARQFEDVVEHAVARAHALRLPPRWTSRTLIAAAMLVAGDDADVVDTFVGRVRSAEGLRDGSPELAFLRWNQAVAGARHATRSGPHWTALAKSLNAYRDGRDLRRIVIGDEPPLLFGIAESPFAVVTA